MVLPSFVLSEGRPLTETQLYVSYALRSQPHSSLLGATLIMTSVFVCLLFVSAAGSAWAATSEPFTLENADIHAVVKQVAALTGITVLFDPEQVKGKITLFAPKGVSPAEALELLQSALALHGYALLSRAEGMWIVPAERVVNEAFSIKVVPLTYARAREVAYALSWVAPPSVRIVPYYPTNSLIISGPPAAVDELIDRIR
jgi:type II secretory pathway component GspD/PulD (secretin)